MFAPPPITKVPDDAVYHLCRSAHPDPIQEQEIQADCEQFLEQVRQLDAEDNWVVHELGRETVHQIQASCLVPPSIHEHWSVGPPFHCSFSAVLNPLYDLRKTTYLRTHPEFQIDSIGSPGDKCREPAKSQLQEWTRQLIGRDGCHLKKITESSGCVCIWNDQDKFTFHFWGNPEAIRQAISEFHYHTAKFIYQNISRKVTFDTYAQLIHGFSDSASWYQWFHQTHH